MVSSSESLKKSVGGLWGGVCANGFSDREWLFVMVVVDTTRNATLCQSGSAGTDSDDVSSCSKV